MMIGGYMKIARKSDKRKLPYIFIIFFSMLLYPLFGIKLDSWFVPEGVIQKHEKPVAIVSDIMNGYYQSNMDAYLRDNMYGKNLMVKIRSQLSYSLFNVSDNSNVVIGDDKQLFEPVYLEYSFNIHGQPADKEIQKFVNKLNELRIRLRKNGKQMYIFITPSKTRYYADAAPYYYKICKGDTKELAYDKFIKYIRNTELKVFDSISYIDKNKHKFSFPLWYPTGIHWSRILGNNVVAAFNDYLRKESGYDIGQISVSYRKSGQYDHPDADLYETLNLFFPPAIEYYHPEIKIKEGSDKPNVFLRGGSFMGQSLSALVNSHIFSKDIYFENNYYFTDSFSELYSISAFNAYEELDVCKYLEDSDILILEINEAAIQAKTWGFVDYILENYKVPEGR